MTDERMIAVPGGELYAVADGDGPPIVLIHAGVVDSRVWEPFVPLLTRAGYRTIRYDARGFGRSTTEDVEFRRADDLLAVLDAFGAERAALVGNSQGGQIALDLAVTHPARVAALVQLASGIGGLDVPMSPRDEAVEERYEQIDQAGDLDALTDFELALWGAGVEQPVERLSPELRTFLRPMFADANEGRPRGRQVPIDPPAAERLDQLTMPVLFVHGGLDFSYVELFGRHLEATVPSARLVVMPGVAHLVAVENPDETARLVLELIRPLGDFSRAD
jgi:pimeloyl-ACP methyl ester carboxylesterase